MKGEEHLKAYRLKITARKGKLQEKVTLSSYIHESVPLEPTLPVVVVWHQLVNMLVYASEVLPEKVTLRTDNKRH